MNEPQVTNTFSSPGEAAALNLVGLLREWERREPGIINIMESTQMYTLRSFPSPLVLDIRPWHNGLILQAVIEAIEARGWDWEIYKFTSDGEVTFCGEVNKPGGISEDDRLAAQESSHSPAHALLTSYVKALRAQGGE